MRPDFGTGAGPEQGESQRFVNGRLRKQRCGTVGWPVRGRGQPFKSGLSGRARKRVDRGETLCYTHADFDALAMAEA